MAACDPAPELPDVADSVDWKRGFCARNWGLTCAAGRLAQRAAKRAFCIACLEYMMKDVRRGGQLMENGWKSKVGYLKNKGNGFCDGIVVQELKL